MLRRDELYGVHQRIAHRRPTLKDITDAPPSSTVELNEMTGIKLYWITEMSHRLHVHLNMLVHSDASRAAELSAINMQSWGGV